MKLSGSKSMITRVIAVVAVLSFLVITAVLNLNSGVAYAAPGDDFCVEHPTNPNCIIATLTPSPTATAVATATPSSTPHGVQKIRICENTDSHSNPYVNINVDQDSADGQTGNDNGQGDHYLTHTGGIWYDGAPDHSWGDIIPPVAANGANPGHNGRNWNSQGQAIWNNNCNMTTVNDPTPTPNDPGDVCANIDGVQTSVPNDYHLDASQRNCVQFELGGAPDNGTGGGQVLGASTMAGTGAAEDLLAMIFAVGSFSFGIGVRKYTYAGASQK
jgi:hypothetical protein